MINKITPSVPISKKKYMKQPIKFQEKAQRFKGKHDDKILVTLIFY